MEDYNANVAVHGDIEQIEQNMEDIVEDPEEREMLYQSMKKHYNFLCRVFTCYCAFDESPNKMRSNRFKMLFSRSDADIGNSTLDNLYRQVCYEIMVPESRATKQKETDPDKGGLSGVWRNKATNELFAFRPTQLNRFKGCITSEANCTISGIVTFQEIKMRLRYKAGHEIIAKGPWSALSEEIRKLPCLNWGTADVHKWAEESLPKDIARRFVGQTIGIDGAALVLLDAMTLASFGFHSRDERAKILETVRELFLIDSHTEEQTRRASLADNSSADLMTPLTESMPGVTGRAKRVFDAGDRVDVFMNKDFKWSPGTVTRVRSGNKYDVRLDETGKLTKSKPGHKITHRLTDQLRLVLGFKDAKNNRVGEWVLHKTPGQIRTRQAVKRTYIERHQFIELMIRVAMHLRPPCRDTGGGAPYEPVDAFDEMLQEDIPSTLDSVWIGKTDEVKQMLRDNKKLLDTVFDGYSQINKKTDKENKTIDYDEWQAFVTQLMKHSRTKQPSTLKVRLSFFGSIDTFSTSVDHMGAYNMSREEFETALVQLAFYLFEVDNVGLATAHKAGDRVDMRWEDGKWYPARVTQVSKAKMREENKDKIRYFYDIAFEDEVPAEGASKVHAAKIRHSVSDYEDDLQKVLSWLEALTASVNHKRQRNVKRMTSNRTIQNYQDIKAERLAQAEAEAARLHNLLEVAEEEEPEEPDLPSPNPNGDDNSDYGFEVVEENNSEEIEVDAEMMAALQAELGGIADGDNAMAWTPKSAPTRRDDALSVSTRGDDARSVSTKGDELRSASGKEERKSTSSTDGPGPAITFRSDTTTSLQSFETLEIASLSLPEEPTEI